jgi:hypothetical protein
MKSGELIEAIERFFLDDIGAIAPGMMLFVGWIVLLGTRTLSGIGKWILLAPEQDLLLLVVLGMLGHLATFMAGLPQAKGQSTEFADLVVNSLREGSGANCELRQIRPLPLYRSIPISITPPERLARSQAASPGSRPACPS